MRQLISIDRKGASDRRNGVIMGTIAGVTLTATIGALCYTHSTPDADKIEATCRAMDEQRELSRLILEGEPYVAFPRGGAMTVAGKCNDRYNTSLSEAEVVNSVRELLLSNAELPPDNELYKEVLRKSLANQTSDGF